MSWESARSIREVKPYEGVTVMEHRVLSSIRKIVGLTFIGTLTLFFIAEIVLSQDVFFVHPVVALAISSIAITLWYWGQDRRVT
jgi:hypothetical protein